MAEGYKAYIDENVRLIILKALSQENNASLNDSLLDRELERFGYRKSRDYLRNQLLWLETEVAAIKLTTAGSAMIATLTISGRDHIERRRFLSGVQRPSDLE